jgi:undecaprenyl-diphosphatase
MSILEAIILAIIEGITEFLPISSTGHMIIGSSLMGIASDPFVKMFTVAIQFGTILSVVVLYWKRFFQSFRFYYKIALAFVPAAVIGYLLNDRIDAWLERVDIVGYTLLIGGIFFLFLDKIFPTEDRLKEEPGYLSAIVIGFFQTIAMIPGVSRSAATIIGGLSQKLTRKAAAEFSFFLAVPTMFGAMVLSMYKFFKNGGTFGSAEITALAVGNVVAFIVAMIAIRSFITYLTKHGFKIFGYYRIVLGAVILILYYMGVELSIV